MALNGNIVHLSDQTGGSTAPSSSTVDWGGIINSGIGALSNVYDNYINAQMQAAGMANAASAAAQQQQYLMNQDLMAQQFAYNANSALTANALQAQLAREAMTFNAEEAEKQRNWMTNMSATAYQRAVKDMRKAGINPILAATNGGANVGSGSSASISTAKAAQASGVSGLGVGNYSGQGYHLSDTFATFGAILGTVGNVLSALQANNGLNNAINTVREAINYTDHKLADKREYWVKNNSKVAPRTNAGYYYNLKEDVSKNPQNYRRVD